MQIYFTIVSFNFQRFLTYPFEMIAQAVRRVVEISFLVLFWSVIASSSSNGVDFHYLIGYFFLTAAVSDIASAGRLRLGQFIQNSIKSGEISNVFLRPVNMVAYMWSTDVGKRGVTYLLGVVCGIIGLALQRNITIISLLHALVALVLAFVIAFSLNLILGLISFYTVEARSLRFICEHVIRVFSGAIVPLQFFPDTLRSVVRLSPFPSMIYTPVNALREPGISAAGWEGLVISAIWAVVLGFLAMYLWNKAVNSYDAVGL